ncbi:probable ATP-dependent RNA helicase DHX34, partial [Lingula anatina]|uniref:Probable ATP-dependent RNA helicase DHX34 n=1 Tax=Lingula anatina TaxID=7574 RepID=A0A1S3H0X2_LINAN
MPRTENDRDGEKLKRDERHRSATDSHHSRHRHDRNKKKHKHKHGHRGRSRSSSRSGKDREEREAHRSRESCSTSPHRRKQEDRHDSKDRYDSSPTLYIDRHKERKQYGEDEKVVENSTTYLKHKHETEATTSVTQGDHSQEVVESSSESEKEFDDFDFECEKSTLDKMFFREDDLIKRGSQDYNDFWAFLKKFKAFNRKKAMQQKGNRSKSNLKESKLGIPMKYDKRYKINLSVATKDMEDMLKYGRSKHKEKSQLNKERIAEFRSILLHYFDFCQKQKFSKLIKIKKDQQNLPIYQYKEKIIETLKEYQVIVVAGDTGCGKSTQVPQYLLQAGYTNIACTQPRRIACISLSKRVGYETLNEYGSEVAYQVRFERSRTRATRIIFLTEGLLLRQMTTDPFLKQYNVIVIDEVHERHIYTDFLLGVVKCLLQHRDDIKVVLMSATINIDMFSGYFDHAPVIKVPGRLYPIQLQYHPIDQADKEEKKGKIDPSPYLKIMQMINHKYPDSERGDLLIFLSGMAEIMTLVEAANMFAQKSKRWIVLPLHSALSISEQDKVFDYPPEGIRKCIISTNIAETSVTIDGVRFIVDSGKVKEMSYDPKYKMRKLQEFWISRASAEQRKGRAGRTGPGVCYRLYDESDYDAFQEYATPEIQRVPLDTLILQMVSMGLPDARKFPFIEPPSDSSIENSVAFLKEQGALTEDEKLTPIGEMLAQLPVDVVIGKMLILGSIFQMIDPVLSIAAALSVQSPFTSRAHTDHDAISSRKSIESDHGDPFTLLNAFDEWIQVKAEGRGTRKWCKRKGLEEQRFYEMTKLKRQFQELLKDHGLVGQGSAGEAPDERYLSSQERAQRHGDRKRLRELRREQQKATKKRKVLKVTDEDFKVSSDEENDVEANVKDLEFRLSHDLDQLQEKSSRSFTLRDINLLKLILCSGLYPQVAIADECNSYKADSEQAFHTKSKPFVVIHPTSVFSYKPEVLQLQEIDMERTEVGNQKYVMSSKHELVAFVSLLETNKPYLVNLMRVPALQTLLLYSNSLDTNADCTRIVCEGWLELRFAEVEAAENIMSAVIQLRTLLQELLKMKLQDTINKKEQDEKDKFNPKFRKLERLLAGKLTSFLDSKVVYSIRRVLAAELQHLYLGPSEDVKGGDDVISDIMKFSTLGGDPHPVKGGIQVKEYLVYN